jgi:ribosomal protein S18 acetylase RimI-like enzyme
VAEVDRFVVAFGRCRFTDPDPAEPRLPGGWYLAGVIVDEDYRRRGIGRRVTAHRLDWLRERTDVVYYMADESNGASIDLHAAFGFEEMARSILPPVRRTDAPQALFRKSLR